ncbi:MAG TPA: YhbY family RNA-binding protein [Candidatus Nanoarchaeia archaeon]|nr:YhbY family RNA-binding protein [Candidatus Nanoarchaeia archaeon]
MKKITKFQIGKSGITSGVLESLTLALKNHKQVRISTLKSSGRSKENIGIMAKEIISKLNEKCDYRIIGFTIVLTKIPLLKKKQDK